MRIKLDENLPAGLVGPLAELGHDAHTVVGEELGGESDERLWTACLAEGQRRWRQVNAWRLILQDLAVFLVLLLFYANDVETGSQQRDQNPPA